VQQILCLLRLRSGNLEFVTGAAAEQSGADDHGGEYQHPPERNLAAVLESPSAESL
jgi:hypothetical protein